MKFVQCPAHVFELESVRQCRDERASQRTEGLRLTRALVAAAASSPAKVSVYWKLYCNAPLCTTGCCTYVVHPRVLNPVGVCQL